MRISVTLSWADARLGALGMSALGAHASAKPRQYGDAVNDATRAANAWSPPV